MSVYVGTREYRYKYMVMSHMIADTLEELHEMAYYLGIPKEHFQNKPGKPHYDISKGKKLEAIKNGALLVNDRIIIQTLNDIYKK